MSDRRDDRLSIKNQLKEMNEQIRQQNLLKTQNTLRRKQKSVNLTISEADSRGGNTPRGLNHTLNSGRMRAQNNFVPKRSTKAKTGFLSARESKNNSIIEPNQIVHDKDGIVSVSVLIELRKNESQKYVTVLIYTSDTRQDLVVRAQEICEQNYDQYSQLDQEWIFN